MDVFSCFPNAIISNQWELGEVERGTVRGKVFKNPVLCDVIVDESTYAVTDRSPSAEYEDSDTLVYAKPSQMPSLKTNLLASSYVWHDMESDIYYEIRECSLGKNQETGEVEHIEFLLRPTKVILQKEDNGDNQVESGQA